jgi:hypothetical protein
MPLQFSDRLPSERTWPPLVALRAVGHGARLVEIADAEIGDFLDTCSGV